MGDRGKRMKKWKTKNKHENNVIPWANLLNVDDHCFEDFRYAASILSI